MENQDLHGSCLQLSCSATKGTQLLEVSVLGTAPFEPKAPQVVKDGKIWFSKY